MIEKRLELACRSDLTGTVTVPGSKSITNRAYLLSALSAGAITIFNDLDADDTSSMRQFLRRFCEALNRDTTSTYIRSRGGLFQFTEGQFNVGEAGTVARLTLPILAFSSGCFEVNSGARMQERPMRDMITTLNKMGANIESINKNDSFPFKGEPGNFNGEIVQIDVSRSSQFLSGLLIAAPLIAPKKGVHIQAKGELISKPYVTMTIKMMADFGVQVKAQGADYFVAPQSYRAPDNYKIEPDLTSASYFMALGALSKKGITIKDIPTESLQGDYCFVDILKAMGAQISNKKKGLRVKAPAIGKLQGGQWCAKDFPDAAMTLAVLGAFTEQGITITGIESWRHKESDRLLALVEGLRRAGVCVCHGEDWIEVRPQETFRVSAHIRSFKDHRVAMSLSLLSTRMTLYIENPECVMKTFPTYFDELRALTL